MRPPRQSLKPPGHFPKTCHERPLKVFAGAESVFLELGRMLRLVQSGKVKVTEKSRRPTDASCRQLEQALIGDDLDLAPPDKCPYGYEDQPGPVRAHAWGVLLQQCGWAKTRAGVLKLTEDGKSLLASPNADLFAIGVGSFLSDPDFDELNRVNYIRGQTGKAKRWMIDPGERRESVAEAMGQLPVGEWVHFDKAYTFTLSAGGDFKVGGAGMLYICDAHYGLAAFTRAARKSGYLLPVTK